MPSSRPATRPASKKPGKALSGTLAPARPPKREVKRAGGQGLAASIADGESLSRRLSHRPAHETPDRAKAAQVLENAESSLLDIVDNLLSQGVMLNGEAVIGVADVDLVYLRLSALLAAADKVLGTTDFVGVKAQRPVEASGGNPTGKPRASADDVGARPPKKRPDFER